MVITLKLDRRNLQKNPENGRIAFRYSDIETIPEWPEGPLVELIEGDLFMVPSPDIKHQRISMQLESMIQEFLKKHPVGEMFHAPVDVLLSEVDVVIPDICIILKSNANKIMQKNVQGAPDFVIEILSTNEKRDVILKKNLYERYQVKEYWIVDPEKESVAIYTFTKETRKLTQKGMFSGEKVITSMLLPKFEVVARDIFQFESA
jgi:Uma2 family endonuclease